MIRKSSKEGLLLIGMFTIMIGALLAASVSSEAEFKELTKTLDKKLKKGKHLEKMTLKKLQIILDENVKIENYEEAAKIKQVIDFRRSKRKKTK